MAATQVDVLLAGIRDTSGEPLAAGKVYTYEAGTTDNKTTWTDIDKSSAAANPVILDSNGRAQIYAEGNYKFVIKDSDDATVYTWDDLTYKLLDSDTYYIGSSTGSSNAYVLTNSIAVSAYTAGQVFRFIPNFSNTGTATANVDSLGAKTIKTKNGAALQGGELRQSRFATLQYDGTDLILMDGPTVWFKHTQSTTLLTNDTSSGTGRDFSTAVTVAVTVPANSLIECYGSATMEPAAVDRWVAVGITRDSTTGLNTGMDYVNYSLQKMDVTTITANEGQCCHCFASGYVFLSTAGTYTFHLTSASQGANNVDSQYRSLMVKVHEHAVKL